jgi:ankyrin repeat protein
VTSRTTFDAQLVEAIWRRDLAAVRGLLAGGADARAREASSGLTALMIAAGCGEPDIVKALLEAGADVFACDSRAGGTPLHKACQGGSLGVVRLLVEAGAFVDAVAPTTGHTPLTEAMWFAWPDIVAYLLDHGARLGVQTHYGFSVDDHYNYEVKVNQGAQAQMQEIGAALEQRQAADRQAVEQQPLMAAVAAGHLEEVKRLLAAGAPVDERAPMLSGFNDAHTPLLVAARDGHTEIVAELLKAGADVNAVEPTFVAVPLHKAVYNGHAEITRLLAEHPGVDLDVQGATNGYTPLLDALWHGYGECAEILLLAGARIDLQGHAGERPLDLARSALGPDHRVTRLLAEARGVRVGGPGTNGA